MIFNFGKYPKFKVKYRYQSGEYIVYVKDNFFEIYNDFTRYCNGEPFFSYAYKTKESALREIIKYTKCLERNKHKGKSFDITVEEIKQKFPEHFI